jgi:hypothetical protein
VLRQWAQFEIQDKTVVSESRQRDEANWNGLVVGRRTMLVMSEDQLYIQLII